MKQNFMKYERTNNKLEREFKVGEMYGKIWLCFSWD